MKLKKLHFGRKVSWESVKSYEEQKDAPPLAAIFSSSPVLGHLGIHSVQKPKMTQSFMFGWQDRYSSANWPHRNLIFLAFLLLWENL